MENKRFLSTTELAKILGISRIAVYKKVKKGEIKAFKVGHDFVIDKRDLGGITDKELTKKDKLFITDTVSRVVEEYGETLKLLGRE